MGSGFARLHRKVLIRLLPALVALSLWFCGTAGADVYDDFSSDGIDSGKWTLSGTPGLFSQSKGRLHFSCKTDAGATLVSTRLFTAGFFRMEFYDFYSTNDAPPRRSKGSFAALGLGPRNNYVRMLRGRVSTGGYFEANYFENNVFQLSYLSTAVKFGQLGLYYDGTKVSCFYNNGLDPDKGWQRVGPRVTPGWNSPPELFISGYPGESGRTTFSASNVEHMPAPLPPSLLKRLEK
jgi:hypothetical protein